MDSCFKAMFSDKFTSIDFIIVKVSVKDVTHQLLS